MTGNADGLPVALQRLGLIHRLLKRFVLNQFLGFLHDRLFQCFVFPPLFIQGRFQSLEQFIEALLNSTIFPEFHRPGFLPLLASGLVDTLGSLPIDRRPVGVVQEALELLANGGSLLQIGLFQARFRRKVGLAGLIGLV